MFEAIWMRLTWWRWARCWACGRRVWGAYRCGTVDLLCDRDDCPMSVEAGPPVYATHEDALRDVMRTGRAAVFGGERPRRVPEDLGRRGPRCRQVTAPEPTP